MLAIIKDVDGLEVGRVTVAEGLAVPSNEYVRQLLLSLTVMEGGNPPVQVTFEDGDRYVQALPSEFRAGYLYVEVVST